MPRAADLIAVAQGEVGYSRWADPLPGTKYGRWYADVTGSPYYGESGVPYCAMFVSWCLDRAGVACEGFPRAVAIDRRDGFNRAVEPKDALGGDVIGFDWNTDAKGDHVGIVTGRAGDLVTISTIEGNTGWGEVLECTRSLSQCTIAVRPYFEEAESPAKQEGLLDVDGIGGTNTITRWQEQMQTGADGVISDQPEANDRWHRTVWAVEHGGGYYGSPLIRSAQWILAGAGYDIGPDGIDGLWGSYFSAALQTYLKRKGYYDGPIDSDFAQHSVKALQRSLNDGIWK